MKDKYLKSTKLSIVLFLTLFALNTVVFMTKNMFTAAMAVIVEDGVMTKSQTGAISAAFWFVYAITQVIGGFAADKYSPFKLILIGLVSGIISNLVIYINSSYNVIMTVWCINAAFQFGLWPGTFKIISTQVNPKLRGTAIFWILFTTSLGQAISMLIASSVSHWQQNFIISAVSLVFITILLTVIYKPLERKMIETDEIKTRIPDSALGKKAKMSELIKISGLPALLVIALMIGMTSNGIKMVAPVMLMECYDNLPAAVATRLSIVLIVFAVLGMFITSLVRFKITQNEIKGVVILLSCGVPMLALTYFIGEIHYFVILALLAVAVAFVQGAQPFTNSFAAARFTVYGRSGTISGILNAIAAVGNVVASYVFPRLAESMPWNIVTTIWTGSIIAAVVIALCMIRLWTLFIKREEEVSFIKQ